MAGIPIPQSLGINLVASFPTLNRLKSPEEIYKRWFGVSMPFWCHISLDLTLGRVQAEAHTTIDPLNSSGPGVTWTSLRGCWSAVQMPTVLTVQAHQKRRHLCRAECSWTIDNRWKIKISYASICRSLVIAVFLFTKSFSDMYVQEYVYIYITSYHQYLFRDDLIINIYSLQPRNLIYFEECHSLS